MADKFIWYELMTSDRDSAIAFYKAVVGWNTAQFTTPEMGDFIYTILSAGERPMGGLMVIDEEMRAAGMRPAWIGYIGVADTDLAAKAVVEAGGALRMGPDDIPTVGRFAMVTDPGGAAFYLLTPLPQDEEPSPAEPETPGLVSWHELYSSIGEEAAFGFYSGQFGWETLELMEMGPMGKYRIFGDGGAAMGGMMDKPERAPASAWGFYFNVEGIDSAIERINANGGRVVMGPHEVPGGSWVVQGVDPQGASFALVSTTR